MIRGFTHIAAIVMLALLAASCPLEGQFGDRKFGEDTYRRTNETPEFGTNEAVDWVYVFKKKHGERESASYTGKRTGVGRDAFKGEQDRCN